MIKFLLWMILLAICWPMALIALVVFPVIWLISLPFQILGLVMTGVLAFIWALFTLPARLLGWQPAR